MDSNIKETLDFVADKDFGERLDVYLSERIGKLSRSKIYNLIRRGNILVNGLTSKPGYNIKQNDVIKVVLPEPPPSEIIGEKIPLTILYEDKYYIAVNKPVGMVVHPGAGHFFGTLVSALVNYTSELSSLGGKLRPGLVHRLDKDTSGIVVAAKTDEAHWKLSKLFADRSVFKEYRAFVWGFPKPESALIDAPIGRSSKNRKKFIVSDSGRKARTCYQTISNFGIMSSIKLILETGRTHQARVHLNFIGHPVVGDLIYGGGLRHLRCLSKKEIDLGELVLSKVERQMLHAFGIRFCHPFTGENIEIEAPLPADFIDVESTLRSGC